MLTAPTQLTGPVAAFADNHAAIVMPTSTTTPETRQGGVLVPALDPTQGHTRGTGERLTTEIDRNWWALKTL